MEDVQEFLPNIPAAAVRRFLNEHGFLVSKRGVALLTWFVRLLLWDVMQKTEALHAAQAHSTLIPTDVSHACSLSPFLAELFRTSLLTQGGAAAGTSVTLEQSEQKGRGATALKSSVRNLHVEQPWAVAPVQIVSSAKDKLKQKQIRWVFGWVEKAASVSGKSAGKGPRLPSLTTLEGKFLARFRTLSPVEQRAEFIQSWIWIQNRTRQLVLSLHTLHTSLRHSDPEWNVLTDLIEVGTRAVNRLEESKLQWRIEADIRDFIQYVVTFFGVAAKLFRLLLTQIEAQRKKAAHRSAVTSSLSDPSLFESQDWTAALQSIDSRLLTIPGISAQMHAWATSSRKLVGPALLQLLEQL